MKSILIILALFVSVQAGSLERKRVELDSLKQELGYSRRMAEHDSTYAVKVFEDSIRVAVAQEQFADEVEDSMEPNKGWVWFTVCSAVSATILVVMTLSGI